MIKLSQSLKKYFEEQQTGCSRCFSPWPHHFISQNYNSTLYLWVLDIFWSCVVTKVSRKNTWETKFYVCLNWKRCWIEYKIICFYHPSKIQSKKSLKNLISDCASKLSFWHKMNIYKLVLSANTPLLSSSSPACSHLWEGTHHHHHLITSDASSWLSSSLS